MDCMKQSRETSKRGIRRGALEDQMSRTRLQYLSRWAKVGLVGVALCLIVCAIKDIAVLYANRMTPFAESVLSATSDLHRKMLALEGVRDADAVAKALGGEFQWRLPLPDESELIVAKRKMAGIRSGAEDASGYKVYDLPPIEDYRGHLVMRFSLDGNLLDYMIVYAGGEDE